MKELSGFLFGDFDVRSVVQPSRDIYTFGVSDSLFLCWGGVHIGPISRILTLAKGYDIGSVDAMSIIALIQRPCRNVPTSKISRS